MSDFEGIMFFRCKLCNGVVSPWDIKEHKGCPKCAHRKLAPTNLSILEMAVQLFKHPKIWEWKDVTTQGVAKI